MVTMPEGVEMHAAATPGAEGPAPGSLQSVTAMGRKMETSLPGMLVGGHQAPQLMEVLTGAAFPFSVAGFSGLLAYLLTLPLALKDSDGK
jgi:hypothetical protein